MQKTKHITVDIMIFKRRNSLTERIQDSSNSTPAIDELIGHGDGDGGSSSHEVPEDDDDGESIESGFSKENSSQTTTRNKPDTPKLAQKESQLVTRSKVLVAIVLLVATAVVATVTYQYTTNEELKDFETRVSDSKGL